jgi:hypothetical protein
MLLEEKGMKERFFKRQNLLCWPGWPWNSWAQLNQKGGNFFFFLGSKDLYSFMKEKELKMDTNEWEEFWQTQVEKGDHWHKGKNPNANSKVNQGWNVRGLEIIVEEKDGKVATYKQPSTMVKNVDSMESECLYMWLYRFPVLNHASFTSLIHKLGLKELTYLPMGVHLRLKQGNACTSALQIINH